MGLSNLIKKLDVPLGIEDILGYHGTSVEAVLELSKTRKLPNDGLVPDSFSMVQPDYDPELRIWYAHQIAVRHYLIDKLPFKVPSDWYLVVAQSLVDEKLKIFRDFEKKLNGFMDLAKNAGLNQEDVIDLIKKGYEERKGCLLAMSRKMELDFKKRSGEDDFMYIEFITPGGVGINYISAIQPLGKYECKKLKNIK